MAGLNDLDGSSTSFFDPRLFTHPDDATVDHVEEAEDDDAGRMPRKPRLTRHATSMEKLRAGAIRGNKKVADGFVYAFDIDGVLVRGGRAIPQAIEALKILNGENEWNIVVPHIFLTNGGGKSEEQRCADLSRQLMRPIDPGQFICGHTPMREMAEKYKTVLVVGGEGETCRHVAESYGFKDVVTPGDIIKHNSSTAPFRKLTQDEYANSRSRSFTEDTIDAVFVFADSRDWASDIQIMVDLAMSKGGRIGTVSETFDEGPPFYFSHNDVVWSAAHEQVRLGMGALRRMFEVIFQDLTRGRGKLHTFAFGKPQVSTFQFASRLLNDWRGSEHGLVDPAKTIYFVGDTPESDIRGTNAVNEISQDDWYSILVKTGVYQDGTEPAYKPRVIVDTVLDAVMHGMRRELEGGGKEAGTDDDDFVDVQDLSIQETGVAADGLDRNSEKGDATEWCDCKEY